jgi:hypothetical protein
MIWAFILHLGVTTIVVSVVLLGFNFLMEACGQDSDSARENYSTLAGFFLIGGVLVAIAGVRFMLNH